MRKCSACGVVKDLLEFHRNKNESLGRTYDCADCRRAKLRQLRVIGGAEFRAKRAKYQRERRRRIELGIGPARYAEMLAEQCGRCAICGTDKPGGNSATQFHVDHDHTTHRVRGLLCTNCNMGIGQFRDDDEILFAAAIYLQQHRKLSVR